MATIQDALRILSGAERELRELMEKALREQRYKDVGEIAQLADGLARLLSVSPRASSMSSPSYSHPKAQARTQSSVGGGDDKLKRTRSDYPKFERDGDRLVKVGWSKRNKTTYEHRAPRETVLTIIRNLSRNLNTQQEFSIEEMLPIENGTEGNVPTYQVYLVIAWLIASGAIEKRGRDRYRLECDTLLDGDLDVYWNLLPDAEE